ncbi:S1 family peptidase [Streptomyces daliensis]|uniref:S1 family peptidase n=1 Tax=Streptomyces daliensis TaxID=299421 RepID=A0A8T4J346_9ACTN|nr:S1 family peptidase [Streptomyces daliensis]
MLRNVGVVTGAALAAGALALTAMPATAGEPAPPPSSYAAAAAKAAEARPAPPVPGAMLDAMRRDLGLTPAEVRTRVASEHRAPTVEKALSMELGTRYGGAWTTGPTSKLVVGTTSAAEADTIAAAGATPKVVDHGLAELDAAKAALDRAAERRTPDGVPAWSVDVRHNTVTVFAARPAEARRFVDRSGADASAVRVVKSAEKPRPYYDLRGGDAYYMGGGRCSVGFPVTKGTQQGFVTAGHCGRAGTSTTGYNQVAQGTFQGSSFPGNDYAWVAANSNWTATPYVKGQGGANVTVAGSQQAPVGSSICRSGSTTGWHCGTIQQHNTSVTYPQGTVSGVTRTSVCAEPGDSGGSFISGSQAQGMTSGGSGNCSSGGTTYYQPVTEALSVYGLTLRTSGGEEPPPTGCAKPSASYAGSLTSGEQRIEPNGTSYESTASGPHTGCLKGPSSADFDLYLQKLNGSTWTTVASGTSPGPDETVTYDGTAGTYRFLVHAYSGSGSYALDSVRP